MITYKSHISCSFILEGMEDGDAECDETFTSLRENEKFNSRISDFIKWDLDSDSISGMKIIAKKCEFSDVLEGVINSEIDFIFQCRSDIDELDEDSKEDFLWDLKNGFLLHYEDGNKKYDLIIRGEDAELSYEKILFEGGGS